MISLSAVPQVPVWLWDKGQELRVPGYWEMHPAIPFSQPPGAANLGGQQGAGAGAGAPTGAMGDRTGRMALGQTKDAVPRAGLPVAVPRWEAELLPELPLAGIHAGQL